MLGPFTNFLLYPQVKLGDVCCVNLNACDVMSSRKQAPPPKMRRAVVCDNEKRPVKVPEVSCPWWAGLYFHFHEIVDMVTLFGEYKVSLLMYFLCLGLAAVKGSCHFSFDTMKY